MSGHSKDPAFAVVSTDTHGATKIIEEPIGWFSKDGQIDEDQSARYAIVRAAAEFGRART